MTVDRRGATLRRQLLVLLVALSMPLLVVGAVGALLLHVGTSDQRHATDRIEVAAQDSDLQARVSALTTSLTSRPLLLGDPTALSDMLRQTSEVERGFAALRERVPVTERGRVEEAYGDWQQLVLVLATLPPRFPVMRQDSAELSRSLSDIGPRILRVSQVLNAAAAENAARLRGELNRAHSRQHSELLALIGLSLAGLVAAVLAAQWMHRRITDPLLALQAAALRFGADLDERVVEDRTPEFAGLAAAFNAMADRLKDGRDLLLAREQRFRALVQNSSDLVAVVDPNFRITYVAPAAHGLLGVAAGELLGLPLLHRVHPDDRQLVATVLEGAVHCPGASSTVSCRLAAPSGEPPGHAELVVSNLLDEPAVAGVVVTIRDVTEQARLHERLRQHAFHDDLTGLANRVLFMDRLAHALTGRDTPAPAVLFCDLDDFKEVNDRLGHGGGDAVLSAVAARLSASLRSNDTAARIGGDEFAVLLEDVTAVQAGETAERLCRAVGVPLLVDGVEVAPRMSVGVAAGRAPGGARELLRQADAAMYQAKQRGKNEVVLFDADLAGDLLARLELKADLQRALREQEFVLRYQPTVDLSSGRINGLEALLRWQHPTRGLVSPVEFIPLAEETGHIVPIGLWVLETACRQVRDWQDRFPHRRLQLSVNVSGRQLEQAGIVADVAAVLALTGFEPTRLTLELTESVLLDRSEQVLNRLHALKALGLRLAIDDFGTGYSSLSYLQRLPLDVLKVDKSFVDDVADSGGGTGEAFAATIVALAHTLGLDSVAEGIETDAQALALLQMGCDTGQGYLFARPLPAQELQAMLGAAAETRLLAG